VSAHVDWREVARLAGTKRLDHVLEADRALPALIIRIVDRRQADRADDRRMVGPGRRSDEHPRLRVCGRDQLESQSERAAAARRLDAGNPVVTGMLAEQDRPKQLGEALVARASEIGLGLLRVVKPLLGLLDHLEDRRVARPVAEDSDANVDFLRTRIGVAESDQLEQRIVDDWRKVGKSPCL
jgi:hypothetical protein